MLKVSAIYFRTAIYLLPSVVRGLLMIGLSKECVRSAPACVAASYEEILCNERVAGKNSAVSETRYLSVLGM